MQHSSDGGGTSNKGHRDMESSLDVQTYSISQEIPWRQATSINEMETKHFENVL